MSAKKTQAGPDVRQLNPAELPEAAFPGGKNQAFRVFFEPKVYDDVWRHARENIAVEICGVLVGKWARDANGPFLLASDSIRGEAAASKFAEVTFTHETWAKINQQMDTRFASLAIVGWYHSHPDFGVFLSDRDRFIQEHFFAGAGQIAYVVDPVRQTEGVFAWREGKPALAAHYWVGDRVQVCTAAGEEGATPAPPGPAQPPVVGGAPAGAANPRGLDWVTVAMLCLLCVSTFLLGNLMGGKMGEWERLKIQQEALALGFFANRSPNLREDLEQASRDLGAVTELTQKLSGQYVQLAKEAPENKEQWQGVLEHLRLARDVINRSQSTLRRVQAQYCLSPEEQNLMNRLGEQLKTPPGGKDKKETPAEKKDEKPPEKKG